MRKDFKDRHKNNFWHEMTSFGGYMFPLFVFLASVFTENYSFAKKYFIGILSIYVVAFAIRYFYFKPRPEKFKHDNVIERMDASSFPSLHAARSTFVFAMLSGFVNDAGFTVLSCLIVLLTCYSRMRMKRHDWKDVVAGIVLGLLVFHILN
jgi:membrane-associated phospholipid phosphatase